MSKNLSKLIALIILCGASYFAESRVEGLLGALCAGVFYLVARKEQE